MTVTRSKRIEDRWLLDQAYNYPCVACLKRQTEDFSVIFHHIKTKGSGGDDMPHNLMPLCLQHHEEVHKQGLTKFVSFYETARLWILALGWTFDEVKNKWVHYG